MGLTIQEVEYIANLARLNLTKEEKVRYTEQLSSILDYVVQLQELDTAAIPPTSSVLPARSLLRNDSPVPGIPREDLLQNAPESEAGQFRVPLILDEPQDK